MLKLETAQRQERLDRYLRTLANYRLLVIDEIGFLPLARDQAHLFFQVVAARYERGPAALTSNLGFGAWDGAIAGDGVLTAAMAEG